jgi:hypothetical protein
LTSNQALRATQPAGRNLSANTFYVAVVMGRLKTIGIVTLAARTAKRSAQKPRANDEARNLENPQ